MDVGRRTGAEEEDEEEEEAEEDEGVMEDGEDKKEGSGRAFLSIFWLGVMGKEERLIVKVGIIYLGKESPANTFNSSTSAAVRESILPLPS